MGIVEIAVIGFILGITMPEVRLNALEKDCHLNKPGVCETLEKLDPYRAARAQGKIGAVANGKTE